jgi:hypothetical protein
VAGKWYVWPAPVIIFNTCGELFSPLLTQGRSIRLKEKLMLMLYVGWYCIRNSSRSAKKSWQIIRIATGAFVLAKLKSSGDLRRRKSKQTWKRNAGLSAESHIPLLLYMCIYVYV